MLWCKHTAVLKSRGGSRLQPWSNTSSSSIPRAVASFAPPPRTSSDGGCQQQLHTRYDRLIASSLRARHGSRLPNPYGKRGRCWRSSSRYGWLCIGVFGRQIELEGIDMDSRVQDSPACSFCAQQLKPVITCFINATSPGKERQNYWRIAWAASFYTCKLRVSQLASLYTSKMRQTMIWFFFIKSRA